MYCYYCGKEIIEDAVFCRYCGKRQISADDTAVDSNSDLKPYAIIQAQDEEDQLETSDRPNEKDVTVKKKKVTKTVCIIVAAVILLLATIPVYRMIRAGQIRNAVESAGDHHYLISAGSPGTYWQQSTLESELALCNYNSKRPDSTIMFGTYSRTFFWEINNDLEFIVTYTSGKDERTIYTYSEKDKESKKTWYFDKETVTLYLGDRKFHPVGIEDLHFY